MDLEETDDERFSQEIGICDSSFTSNEETGDAFAGSNDSDELPSFISTPSTASGVEEKPRKTAFKRGDFAWAKHKESWWPAVIKNVYKARRCATVVWTDDCEEDRKKNLAKGFKVSLSSLRPWSCPERKDILNEGAKHGNKFETAVGMLDNFLIKTATNEISMDIFEYLSSIHGTMYTLLDRRCELGEAEEASHFSPDIKKLKMDPLRLRVNVGECPEESKIVESCECDENDNNNDLKSVSEDEEADITKTPTRAFTRVRRNLRNDLNGDSNDDTLTESSPVCARVIGILSSIASDVCRDYLKEIFEDKQKSFLKVLYENRQRSLVAAKLNNFGPLKRDEDVDVVIGLLKQYYLSFTKQESLSINDLEVVMQVYLPEALCYALTEIEGMSFNEAFREICFGILPSNNAESNC